MIRLTDTDKSDRHRQTDTDIEIQTQTDIKIQAHTDGYRH